MSRIQLNGREVEVTEVEPVRGEGIFVVAAEFVDSGESLTDDECDQIQRDYQAELYERMY